MIWIFFEYSVEEGLYGTLTCIIWFQAEPVLDIPNMPRPILIEIHENVMEIGTTEHRIINNYVEEDDPYNSLGVGLYNNNDTNSTGLQSESNEEDQEQVLYAIYLMTY